jgi:putative transposase
LLVLRRIDDCTDEIVGHHLTKMGDRWAALEPVRRGVRRHFGGFALKIVLRLRLRHGWGPSIRRYQFIAELK